MGMYVCLCLMMTLWITSSPSTSSPLPQPQPQPQPFSFSKLAKLIRAKHGPKKAGSSRGAARIPGATVGARGTVGTGGIVADGAPEECAGSKLCVAASGQCCFLVTNQRSLSASPQCPPSC